MFPISTFIPRFSLHSLLLFFGARRLSPLSLCLPCFIVMPVWEKQRWWWCDNGRGRENIYFFVRDKWVSVTSIFGCSCPSFYSFCFLLPVCTHCCSCSLEGNGLGLNDNSSLRINQTEGGRINLPQTYKIIQQPSRAFGYVLHLISPPDLSPGIFLFPSLPENSCQATITNKFSSLKRWIHFSSIPSIPLKQDWSGFHSQMHHGSIRITPCKWDFPLRKVDWDSALEQFRVKAFFFILCSCVRSSIQRWSPEGERE